MFRVELEAIGVLLALLGLLSVAGAAPVKSARTLVTDEDLAGWRAAPEQWAWLLKDGNAGYPMMYTGMRPIGRWRDKSDEWLWHLMLPTTVRRASGVGGADGSSPNRLGCPIHGTAIFAFNAFYPWEIDLERMPYKLKCPIGGETYPSNDFLAGDLTSGPYPDDGSGCVVDGKRYYFLGVYANHAYNSGAVAGVSSFARAYSVTGDAALAHRAGVLLLRIASEYPNGTDRKDRTFVPGYGEYSGMITDFIWSALDLPDLAVAYDEVFPALRADEALLQFAHSKVPEIVTGDDLLEYIEDKLFRSAMQGLLDRRILANVGGAQEAMAKLAVLLDDFGPQHPNSRDALEWLYYGEDGKLRYADNQFYKDGSSYESTSYNDMRKGIPAAAHLLRRLRERHPEQFADGRYPDILERENIANFPRYQEAIRAIGRAHFTIGDDGHVARVPQAVPPRQWPPRASEVLDGYGLAVLRDSADEMNASLFYGGVRGHAHYDPLMIGLFARGRDLLPNIGYPQSWSFAKAWEWSLGTHMTVVVDRDEKPSSTVIGSLTTFDATGPVKVMEASKRPYRKHEPRGEAGPEVTDYRRMVVMVSPPTPGGDGYLLDIFRVLGGRDHLQVWHGPYTPRPVAVEGVSLTTQPTGTLAGPEVEYGQHYKDERGQDRLDPYCHLKHVARGQISGTAAVTWTPETAETVHLRLNFVTADGTELIRADGGAPVAPEKDVLQWAFPHRRLSEGQGAPLRSQFVTVLEPYGEGRTTQSLQALPCTGADPSGYAPVAVEVRYAGGRDILLATGSDTGRVQGKGFSLTGRFGFIREVGGQVTMMHLTRGSELVFGQRVLRQAKPAGRARIVEVRRDKREIVVEGDLGPATALAGRRVNLDNHGERLSSYGIEKASSLKPGRLRLTLDSQGFLGAGEATGFEDGIIQNRRKYVALPMAGLVKMPDGRLDYSDCFYYGAHLETTGAAHQFRVRGLMGYPYQAWGVLHNGGTNDVHLDVGPGPRQHRAAAVSTKALTAAFAKGPEFSLYEYGVGDEVLIESLAHWEAPSPQ